MPPKKVIPDKGKGKAAPPPPPPPTSRPVTVAPVLWQDNASSKVAPGGGILRIAFDQADFERACQDVIVNPRKEAPKPQQETASIQENEGTTAASGIVEETPAVKVKEKKLPVKKEDVALIVLELECSVAIAEEVLRSVGGDLELALMSLTSPSLSKTHVQSSLRNGIHA